MTMVEGGGGATGIALMCCRTIEIASISAVKTDTAGVCEVVELWDHKGSSNCTILHHRPISEDLQVVLIVFFRS